MNRADGLEQNVVADYLDYFGLDQDPFQANTGPLFDGANRRDQFEKLLHLCQFSTSVLAVVGEAGIGKRTFLQELIGRIDDADIVVQMDAPVLGSAQQFLINVVKAFQLPLPTTVQSNQPPADSVRALEALLSEFGATAEEGDPLKILIVENAHQLDNPSLAALLRISQYINEHHCLHVVLFGEPDLAARLEDSVDDEDLLQIFHLAPLTPLELKAYLRFRLDEAGFTGIFPFKDDELRFLWDISQGIPAAMHDAAREILIELAIPAPEEKRLGLPIPHMVALIALGAGLLGALLYSTDGSDSVSQDLPLAVIPKEEVAERPQADLATAIEAHAQDAVPELVQQDDLPAERDVAVASEVVAAPAVSNETTQPPPASVREPQQPAPRPTATAAATTPTPSAETTRSTTIEKTPIASQAPPATASPTPPKPSVPSKPDKAPDNLEQSLLAQAESELLTGDERELLNRAASGYTLQVLAGSTRDAVKEFVAKQANKSDLRTYVATRNGRVNYIVVSGNFPSAEAARSGIAALPESQRRAGAWPRSMQSVHADIEAQGQIE